jgi:competence protein ComGC
MRFVITLLILLTLTSISAQTIDKQLYDAYEKYKEETIKNRRFKHADLQPLINELKEEGLFKVEKLGESIQGRDITMLSIGTGETSVLLWSQMHGNESTATMALFDIFNLFESEDFGAFKQNLLSKLTIHFVPMLNPDGAELFTRRNALGVDLNRDAQRLQSSEAQILKWVRDRLDADFGFNLHDQSCYYTVGYSPNPATISFLAPAYNYPKDINEVRGNAMKVIGKMNDVIQKYAPNQVAKYDDAFEPRAFGDNIQKWGTSTILIESGGYQNDREKQEIRKLNFMSILSALEVIADKTYESEDFSKYDALPFNERQLFDLKIENLSYDLNGKEYTVDVAINRFEMEYDNHSKYYFYSSIQELGDLSIYYGFETLDATGLSYSNGEVLASPVAYYAIKDLDFIGLLKRGITHVRANDVPSKVRYTDHPIGVLRGDSSLNDSMSMGAHATFLLTKDGIPQYAVVNGFLIDLNKGDTKVVNGVVR